MRIFVAGGLGFTGAALVQRLLDDGHQVNVEGTRLIVEETKRVGARKLVYCSTQGVHGHIADPPGDENSAIAPEDYYQVTKYRGEQVVREDAGDALEYTILRRTAEWYRSEGYLPAA